MDAAEARITRLDPTDAQAAARDGALLIDVRSDSERVRYGIVPGSLHIPRTVLEWRLAPDSPWRNPHAGDLGRQIILICDHGYSTVLAAGTLVELGFTHVCDVVGGFAGWRDASLPIVAAPPALDSGELPGMGRPTSPGEPVERDMCDPPCQDVPKAEAMVMYELTARGAALLSTLDQTARA